MKLQLKNVSEYITHACGQLQTLQEAVESSIHHLNDNDLQIAISTLRENSNELARNFNKGIDLGCIDLKMKNKIHGIIEKIQRSPGFAELLGPYQSEMMKLFKKIENIVDKSIEKASKVSKVDQDSISK